MNKTQELNLNFGIWSQETGLSDEKLHKEQTERKLRTQAAFTQLSTGCKTPTSKILVNISCIYNVML